MVLRIRLSRVMEKILMDKGPNQFAVPQSAAQKKALTRKRKTNNKRAVPTLHTLTPVKLDGVKNLQMCLRRNKGVNWWGSTQILKHLELHKNAKPDITPTLRVRAQIAYEHVRNTQGY